MICILNMLFDLHLYHDVQTKQTILLYKSANFASKNNKNPCHPATFGPQFFFLNLWDLGSRVQIPSSKTWNSLLQMSKTSGWRNVLKGLPGLPSWWFSGGIFEKRVKLMLYSRIDIEKPMSSGMNIQPLSGIVIRSNQIIIR